MHSIEVLWEEEAIMILYHGSNVEVAGFELKKNSSGKHKGQTTISKRGRRRLRRVLYHAVLPMLRSNPEFREV